MQVEQWNRQDRQEIQANAATTTTKEIEMIKPSDVKKCEQENYKAKMVVACTMKSASIR